MNHLRIILDQPSLKSDSSKKLIEYNNNDLLEFLSLKPSSKFTEIQFKENKNNPLRDTHEIYIKRTDLTSKKITGEEHIGFGYRLEDIRMISKSTDIKYDDLFIAFLLEVITRTLEFRQTDNDEKIILVTERKKLLNKEYKLKSGFPKLPEFSIFHPDEACIFIDLFCKKRGKFITGPISSVNKGLWYLYSMRTKVFNYQLPWSVIVFMHAKDKALESYFYDVAALGDRLTEMLIAVDEIGMAYYEGANNDSLDTIIYHFNYWVTLYAGVIDSLAWITKHRYGISVAENKDVRLDANKKDQFLQEIYKNNPPLINFVKLNSRIIRLINDPRDVIIHRERLRGVKYVSKSNDINLNTIKVSENMYKNIQAFGWLVLCHSGPLQSLKLKGK